MAINKNSISRWREEITLAHIVPLLAILVLLSLQVMVVERLPWFRDHELVKEWWLRKPGYWFLGLQVLVVGTLLLFWWKHYELRWSWKEFGLGILFGVIGIAFWILPTQTYEWMQMTENPEGFLKWLGVAERNDGFNPSEVFLTYSFEWWGIILIRFFRAVVIVALAEEIFWRGFLMRFVSNPDGDFWKQRFGQFSWRSWFIVTFLFMMMHAPIDYAGAFVFGSIMYGLCVWRKSLFACVTMHGFANLLMGFYALHFGKHGLW